MTGADHPSAMAHVAASAATLAAVRALNDDLRRNLTGGQVVMTAGFAELPEDIRIVALAAVRAFDCFDADNDPHKEHDFGAVTVGNAKVFWKIVAYDCDLRFASPDPADPAVTVRILTVMLAEEY